MSKKIARCSLYVLGMACLTVQAAEPLTSLDKLDSIRLVRNSTSPNRSISVKSWQTVKGSKVMFVETSPIPVKTAMGWLDLCAPDVRPPLACLEKPSLEKLEKTLREYGLVGPRRKHPVC